MFVGFMFGLFVSAAIIGLIIAFMERGEFPGWGPTLGAAFAIGLATAIVNILLEWPLSLLSIPVGGLVGAFVISWLCDMSLKRSAIAAGIYIGVRLVLAFLLAALMSA